MHPLYKKAGSISSDIIGSAIEVHKNKGPGLVESIYERCLLHELKLRNHETQNQGVIKITYKDLVFEEPLRFGIPIGLLGNYKSVVLKDDIHRLILSGANIDE